MQLPCPCNRAPKSPGQKLGGLTLNENALLAVGVSSALLLSQLGKTPPKWLQLGLTFVTAVSLAAALRDLLVPKTTPPNTP